MTKLLTVFVLFFTLAVQATRAENYYSHGGWPTLHQDAGNRRAVTASILPRDYTAWTALAGSSVLTAPVISPDGKTLYVSTGRARGHSNLYAFTLDGTLLWQSDPWEDAKTGIDACAILSSPVVDMQGDIYISDCNQLFALKPDGSTKWTVDLPLPRKDDWVAAQDHPVNAFTTAAFTADGYLLGVTNFGDVLLIDRDTGEVVNTPYRLDSELSPYADNPALPDSLLAQDLVDPEFREWIWQVIFGGSMRSANTPAVSRSGRVFVVGSSSKLGIGALLGFDIDTSASPVTISQAFSTEIGIGSGSSPALSPDEQQVYVSDEEGWLYAISAGKGGIVWKTKTAAAAGAAAVGPDGTVYALQVFPAPAVVALDPKGQIRWQSDVSALLENMPSSWLLGTPVAVANGNPTVTGDAVIVPLVFGYGVPFGSFSVPARSALVALDLNTGKAIGEIVSLPDDSSGITAVLPDGTIVNSIGGVMTSAVSPLRPLINMLLPASQRLLESVGGIQVAVPEKP